MTGQCRQDKLFSRPFFEAVGGFASSIQVYRYCENNPIRISWIWRILQNLRACLDGMVPFRWPIQMTLSSVSKRCEPNGRLAKHFNLSVSSLPHVKPFHSGTVATSSFFTKLALRIKVSWLGWVVSVVAHDHHRKSLFASSKKSRSENIIFILSYRIAWMGHET